MSDLAAALADVRRAHRLLHAYQRRVNDLFNMLAGALGEHGLEFNSWYVIGHQMPPRRSSAFFQGRWAWDLLPSQAIAASFTGAGQGGGPIVVHVHVIADTGFEQHEGAGEPDASAFHPVEECESQLRWSVWRGSPGVSTLEGAWQALHEHFGDGCTDDAEHTFDFAGGRVRHWYGSINLAELSEEDAVIAKVIAKMREALTR